MHLHHKFKCINNFIRLLLIFFKRMNKKCWEKYNDTFKNETNHHQVAAYGF